MNWLLAVSAAQYYIRYCSNKGAHPFIDNVTPMRKIQSLQKCLIITGDVWGLWVVRSCDVCDGGAL
jgi:hypothetical protein